MVSYFESGISNFLVEVVFILDSFFSDSFVVTLYAAFMRPFFKPVGIIFLATVFLQAENGIDCKMRMKTKYQEIGGNPMHG